MFVSVWVGLDLDVDRFDIECELRDAFKGIGEVTGAGTGKTGCHVDLEVQTTRSKRDVFALVEAALIKAELTALAKVRIDGETFIYHALEE